MTFPEALEQDVLSAARLLLGWDLVHGAMRARIVETEAYRTPDDPGCHAHRGITPRNAVMFGPACRAYMYFTYGNHWMLNIVAHGEGDAAAILIRAARPLEGLDEMRMRRFAASPQKSIKNRSDSNLLSGPGKICQAFGIDRALNGTNLLDPTSPLHLEMGDVVSDIAEGPRIGLAVGCGEELPWRFCDAKNLQWVSRPLPAKLAP